MNTKKLNKMISLFIDNELPIKKRFWMLNQINQNSKIKNKYEEIKQLKKIISDNSFPLKSDNLEIQIKKNINNANYSITKEKFLDYMINSGFMNKIISVIVVTSIILTLFLGFKLYLPLQISWVEEKVQAYLKLIKKNVVFVLKEKK